MKDFRRRYGSESLPPEGDLADVNETELAKDHSDGVFLDSIFGSSAKKQAENTAPPPAIPPATLPPPKKIRAESVGVTSPPKRRGMTGIYTTTIVLCLIISLSILFFALRFSPHSEPIADTAPPLMIETDTSVVSDTHAETVQSDETTDARAPSPPNLGIFGEQHDGEHGGVLITAFPAPDSDAGAKLRVGDVITRIGDIDIVSTDDLSAALENYSPQDTAEVFVLRNGQILSFYVFLTE